MTKRTHEEPLKSATLDELWDYIEDHAPQVEHSTHLYDAGLAELFARAEQLLAEVEVLRAEREQLFAGAVEDEALAEAWKATWKAEREFRIACVNGEPFTGDARAVRDKALEAARAMDGGE